MTELEVILCIPRSQVQPPTFMKPIKAPNLIAKGRERRFIPYGHTGQRDVAPDPTFMVLK